MHITINATSATAAPDAADDVLPIDTPTVKVMTALLSPKVSPWMAFGIMLLVTLGPAAKTARGQETSPTNTAVRDVGGWAQLNVAPSPIWSFGAGFGMDDPNDADIAPTGRLRNAAGALYIITHPSGPLLMGIEIRRIATTFTAGRKFVNDHFNLGFGFEF
jgi:hypothetical protein